MACESIDMKIPDEVVDELKNFSDAIDEVTEILRPLYTQNFNSLDYQVNIEKSPKIFLFHK